LGETGIVANRWNAILFCDDWSEHDLHLSLLTSGAANVALHLGSAGAAHFASFAEVGNGLASRGRGLRHARGRIDPVLPGRTT
jgi:hypothetical protein